MRESAAWSMPEVIFTLRICFVNERCEVCIVYLHAHDWVGLGSFFSRRSLILFVKRGSDQVTVKVYDRFGLHFPSLDQYCSGVGDDRKYIVFTVFVHIDSDGVYLQQNSWFVVILRTLLQARFVNKETGSALLFEFGQVIKTIHNDTLQWGIAVLTFVFLLQTQNKEL